jgi:hypothetical protein
MRKLIFPGHTTGDNTLGKSRVVGQVIPLCGKRKIGGITDTLKHSPPFVIGFEGILIACDLQDYTKEYPKVSRRNYAALGGVSQE